MIGCSFAYSPYGGNLDIKEEYTIIVSVSLSETGVAAVRVSAFLSAEDYNNLNRGPYTENIGYQELSKSLDIKRPLLVFDDKNKRIYWEYTLLNAVKKAENINYFDTSKIYDTFSHNIYLPGYVKYRGSDLPEIKQFDLILPPNVIPQEIYDKPETVQLNPPFFRYSSPRLDRIYVRYEQREIEEGKEELRVKIADASNALERAKNKIFEARGAISDAKQRKIDVSLAEKQLSLAEQKHTQAYDAYTNGDYDGAKAVANTAYDLAESARKDAEEKTSQVIMRRKKFLNRIIFFFKDLFSYLKSQTSPSS